MADADTRDKRASVVGYGINAVRQYPAADGDLSPALDRVFIATFYAGILPSGAVVSSGADGLLLRRRRHR